MSEFELIDHNTGNTRTFEHDDHEKAEELAVEKRDEMVALGADKDNFEIKALSEPDGGTVDTHSVEMADEPAPEPTTEVVNSPDELAQDPISWLESHNDSFVNYIKGTPAISKQGFRFIQAQFGITTESEVVEWVDDPTGVVVWARAELPDGQAAEAHGEGWMFEDRVDDNEFVRYADTRAKSRAISDLTSAGALAASEVQDE